jgi:hypothetical protein
VKTLNVCIGDDGEWGWILNLARDHGILVTHQTLPLNAGGETVYFGIDKDRKRWMVVPREDCTELYDEWNKDDYGPLVPIYWG